MKIVRNSTTYHFCYTNFMETTEAATAQSSDILNPKSILNAPAAQRPQKLEVFKEHLFANKSALSKTIQDLTHFVRYYPDATDNQLKDYFQHMPGQAYLTSDQKEIIQIGLGIYQQRHKAIKDLRKQFPDDEEGDKALFSALFGKAPKGEIEVKQGPITLYFRCHNEDDFALIHSGAFNIGQEPNEMQKSKAKQFKGVLIYYKAIPALKDSITAENSSDLSSYGSNEVFMHEEQHSILRLFQDAYTEYLKHQDPKYSTAKTVEKLALFETPDIKDIISMITQVKDQRTALKLLYNLLRQERRQIEESSVKDEILAFIKQGIANRDINYYLTQPASENGLYDFFDENTRQNLIIELTQGLDTSLSPAISKAVDDVFVKEYQEQILPACQTAVIALQKNGFSKEDIVSLLINEPLEDWSKAVERFLAEKAKQDYRSLFKTEKAA